MTLSATIKFTTYNVKGVNPIKRAKIPEKMKKEKSVVVFLQETHFSEIEHSKLKRKGFS